MKLKKILLALCIPAVLAGCSPKENSGKTEVYTSFYAMYDFAKEIGGDKADVYNMTPVGSEPHDFEPSASDIAKLSDADIFVYSGNMESWAESAVNAIKNGNTTIIRTSDNIDISSKNDPHVWLSFDNAIAQATAICDGLCTADGENSQYYKDNLADFTEKAETMKKNYQDVIDNAKIKDIVVSHEAYGYMCDEFGLNQIAIENVQGDSDPSPSRMAEIVDFIKKNEIKYIYSEALDSQKIIESIAAETGAKILSLNPFEGDTENRNYFEVMASNLESLKTGLN